MVGMVTMEGPGQVQGLVHIIKQPILVMENLRTLVVLEDKLEVTGDLVHRGMVVALDLALATLTGIGTDLVLQVPMLMVMVVGLGTAMQTPDFCIKSIETRTPLSFVV
jgi:hypothetical protein